MKSLQSPELRLFLGGDVMTGRGIDQILGSPGDPTLYESFVTDARDYVALAESVNGRIPRPVADHYIWGVALEELEQRSPDFRIINLETAVTSSNAPCPDKAVLYRMHPDNTGCLSAAGIDCCVLANNHVLDWGRAGLLETLDVLQRVRIQAAGAGRNLEQARRPLSVELSGNRHLLVVACGSPSSGIPEDWAASAANPGVFLLDEAAPESVAAIQEVVEPHRRPGSVVVASVHWGGNWGYAIPSEQRRLAHALVDTAGVDVVFGHSSHHFKGIEIYQGRPILYGAGDLLTDYEGIGSHRSFRGELALLYFLTIDVTTRRLCKLQLVPVHVRRFQLTHPAASDITWILSTLQRECQKLGTSVQRTADHELTVHW